MMMRSEHRRHLQRERESEREEMREKTHLQAIKFVIFCGVQVSVSHDQPVSQASHVILLKPQKLVK